MSIFSSIDGRIHKMFQDVQSISTSIFVFTKVAVFSCNANRDQKSLSIYNYVSSAQNPIVWSDFIRLNHKMGIHWPTIRAVWYYSFYPFNNKFLFMLATLFFHTIPGMILDALAKLAGQKPM